MDAVGLSKCFHRHHDDERLSSLGHHALSSKPTASITKECIANFAYQTIVALNQPNATVGFELLIRGWNDHRYISAQQAFHAAPSAQWLRWLAWTSFWHDLAEQFPKDRAIFINVSSYDLTAEWLKVPAGLHTPDVYLEIGEQTEVAYDTIQDLLQRTHDAVVGWGIDDLGTGYARSPLYTTGNPLFIKFDRVMLRTARQSKDMRDWLSMMNRYCKRRDMRGICEGIEDHTDFELARECGFRYGQGFYFGHPTHLLNPETLSL